MLSNNFCIQGEIGGYLFCIVLTGGGQRTEKSSIMRLVKFRYKSKEGWGILENTTIHRLKKSPFTRIVRSGEQIPFAKVKILPPAEPTKIVLVGLNYRDHASELNMNVPGEPVIFIKPSTSLVAHKGKIVYPEVVKRLDYEAELAVVIRKKARNILEKQVEKYILGYTCLNDITARDIQKRDGQWTRAKSFDTFCPLGPWIETKINPSQLKIRSYLNGEIKQNSTTRNFIFSVEFLVAFISRIMTLLPGDVISTGTPSGVGPMQRGDTIVIEIEGVGKLENRIV